MHQAVDTNNRLLGAPYQYDAAGNMTHDASHSYTYDAENRLIQVDGGSTATYVYDAEGRRVQKTVGSAQTDYIYDLRGNVVSELNSSTWLNVYLRLNGKPFAQYTLGAPRTQFIHTDHLGSTRLVTSFVPGTPPSYSVYDSMDYLPFGEQIAGYSATSHKFTGKERDSESGLDNFDTRYFGSSLGRFMSPDPLGPGQHPENPQSWNLYAYVLDNPLKLVDPTGQFTCDAKTVSGQQCDNFQAALDKAQEAADKLGEKYGWDSKQYLDAQRAIDAFGDEGVDNGVVIAQGNVGSGQADTKVAGTTVDKTADNPNGQNILVVFDKRSNLLNGDINSLAGLGAHEGVHVADASDWVSSGFSANANPSLFQTERDAYRVEASIGEGLGAKSMGLSFGKRNYDFALPLGPRDFTSMNTMIRREYPRYNLDAFSRNTKITRSPQ